MKKILDILIILIIALLLASFYIKGWASIACALGALLIAAVAFFINKKT